MWKHADLAPNDSISSLWWMWRFLLHRLLFRPTDERRVSCMERASLFVNMDDSLFSFVSVDELVFVRRFAAVVQNWRVFVLAYFWDEYNCHQG